MVLIKAVDSLDSTRESDYTQFEVYFLSIVLEKCRAAVLTQSGSLSLLEASLYEEKMTFQLPLVTDSGTTELQKIPGNEMDTCGKFNYTPKNYLDLVSANDA